jgi:hypothetical protein
VVRLGSGGGTPTGGPDKGEGRTRSEQGKAEDTLAGGPGYVTIFKRRKRAARGRTCRALARTGATQTVRQWAAASH